MKLTRSLFLPCILALVLSHTSQAALDRRQRPTGSVTATDTDTAETTSTTPTSTAPSTTAQTPTTSDTLTPSTTAPLTTSPPSIVTQTITSGTEVVVVTSTPAPTSSEASPTNTSESNKSGSEGLSTGSIIGMSIAGGVAVLGIIGFMIWKFTRKRFTDFDDNEAIKWPDLNTHGGTQESYPAPTRSTGRAGFDTGSEPSSRPASVSYSQEQGRDQYAVPPLPHLNPNQPYHDDPMAPTGYYDPYRGPIPGTLENGGGPEWGPGGEAIPMTQMAGNTGRGSPAPHLGYGVAGGRASPAPPQMGYGGRASPSPLGAYRGASPAPAALAGRASPGPGVGYGGRGSPGPEMAYDSYAGGPR